MFPQNKTAASSVDLDSLRKQLKGPIITVAVIAALFFGLGGAWSLLAPIASAALAGGTISPEGHRKTVQHLEGGIVRALEVKDGDTVKAGDVLMVLEDTQALAAYRVQETRTVSLKAMEARLIAEETGNMHPDWSIVPDFDGRTSAIEDQQRIFTAKLQSIQNEREILGQRIAQLREEISGLRSQIDSQTEQLTLIADEIKTISKLIKQGLARKPRLQELQRQQAGITGQRAANHAAIARAEQSIGESRLQILNLDVRRRDEAANRLGEVRTQIADLEERMTGTKDVLSRTVVTAPVDGTIFNLRIQTTGGVLRPGDPILDIVPDGEELLVDARIPPTDIDVVTTGLNAEVTLSALPQRNLPKLQGMVNYVSADSLTDKATGEVYFLARVSIDKASLNELDEGIELIPGMPADVMIFTGTRTFFDYLTTPLVESINRSFRES